MNLEDINESIENSSLEAKQRKAILNLIDQKINNDMEKLITEFRSLEKQFESKMDAQNSKMDAQNIKMDAQNKTIIWVIGIATAVLSIVLALKK